MSEPETQFAHSLPAAHAADKVSCAETFAHAPWQRKLQLWDKADNGDADAAMTLAREFGELGPLKGLAASGHVQARLVLVARHGTPQDVTNLTADFRNSPPDPSQAFMLYRDLKEDRTPALAKLNPRS